MSLVIHPHWRVVVVAVVARNVTGREFIIELSNDPTTRQE